MRSHLPLLMSLLIAGCGGVSSGGSGEKNVFGQDDREEIRSQEYPWSAIGRLETGCTGTVVGKRLVLTAAHCTIRSGAGTVHPELKYFTPNVIDGQGRNRYFIKKIWYGTNTPEGSTGERGKDWAVLEVDGPIGDTYRPLEVAVPNLANLPYRINLAGYSKDKDNGDTASVHRGCSIRQIAGDRLLHDCDAKAGVSGGPMFTAVGTTATIGAISVSEYRNGAQDSITAPEWAANVANVGISASAFEPTVRALKASVDAGQAAPNLPGVMFKENPNRPDNNPNNPNDPNNPNNPNDPNNPNNPNNPNDPNNPNNPNNPPVGDSIMAQHLIAIRDIRIDAPSLERSSQLGLDSANLIATLAGNYSQYDVNRYAIDLATAQRGLQTALDLVDSPSNDAVAPGRIASALSTVLSLSTRLDGLTRNCNLNQYYCNELTPYMNNVKFSAQQLRSGLVRRQ